MSDVVISVENLSKRYILGHQRAKGDGFRHVIEDAVRSPLAWLRRRQQAKQQEQEEFWALQDVSFEIKKGEVVGIVGRNGAGKSTLLKILSRITDPTSGRITIDGRIASLLEVGTGFHPELTGRENIFLNGAILGMTRVEIKRKFDEIVAFSEVEKFLDTPVKRYSSGMYVRLAFSVAAHLEPEILIVDEVLAVGDAQFQQKCLGKMHEVSANQGRTVLFVSHNMTAVEALCSQGILMQKGRMNFQGSIRDTIPKYLAGFERPANQDLEHETDRSGSGKVRLRRVNFFSDGAAAQETMSGAEIALEFVYNNKEQVKNAKVVFTIYTEAGVPLASVNNTFTGFVPKLDPASGSVRCTIKRLNLNQGKYRVAAALQDEGGETYDHVPSALWFTVAGSRFYAAGRVPDPRYSPLLLEHSWSQ
jgi:lipopolysaccharide transport system ATP-binding protein